MLANKQTQAAPRHLRRLPFIAAGLALLLAGFTGGGMKLGPDAIAGLEPSGTVEMSMVQAAYIGSGSTGSGTLFFRGRSYPFSVSGLGIGGIGVSSIEANGEVYKLATRRSSPGPTHRAATASPSATPAAATCGCRTRAG